jgi:hypothetical protein
MIVGQQKDFNQILEISLAHFCKKVQDLKNLSAKKVK